MTDATADGMTLVVTAKAEIASGIVLFEFRARDGGDLPSFTAGAHVLLRTPVGLARRYSLCNDPAERHRYQIAVKREGQGGGGSISMIDDLRVGDTVRIAPPENYFPLPAEAAHHVLIAGGIGITPILAMARRLHASGSSFALIYCARSPEVAAFLDVLAQPDLAPSVRLHFDGGDPARALDVRALLLEPLAGAHVLCCGPRPLMQAVREASRHWPQGHVHFEDFGTSAQPGAAQDGSFRVRLARTGRVVTVPPGISILEALRRAGISAPCSCEAGTCGECRTALLAGRADHRDYVLDDDEHDSAIMICVSRALSEEITIDV